VSAIEPAPRPADRVVFGVGAEERTAELLAELGARRVLLVAQDRHTGGAERIARALGERAAGMFTSDRPQVPAEVADAAVARARELDVDWVLAHGGGTPIGIAKAVALALPVAVAAVPTTYAGSERTDIWGVTRDGRKTTGRDPRVRPRLVVYDPALTVGLERATSLDSLFNALAHSLEALYAGDATPEARQAAEDSLAPLIEGVRAIAADPRDLAGRTAALRGAALASTSLGGASMGLHHKLAHVLGGLGLPHARTHATLLPYTFGWNAPAATEAVRLLHRAWGSDDPAAYLYDLQRSLGLATSLRTLGVGADQLGAIVDECLHMRYPNPRPIDREALLALLDDALHDRRPSLSTRRLALPAGATGLHATMTASVRGAPLTRARVVVLALHGRGASADRLAADLERRIGPRDDLAMVTPQARDNTWYPRPFSAPAADNAPQLASALSVVEALWRDLAAAVGAERVIVAGFSQGACLALTWLSQTSAAPRRVLAFTGAPTALDGATFTAAPGAAVYIGGATRDPYVDLATLEAGAARFRAAGADVELALTAGDAHAVHPADDAALRRAVEQAGGGGRAYQHGYGSALASEARPGALPRHQNSPRRVPYGLYAEQINGTGFTARRAENRRTWMYRLRPQLAPAPFRARAHGTFVGDFGAGVALPEVLGYRPLPLPAAPTTFLDGLTTFAGAGDPSLGRGAAIHLYAATADMVRTAFGNIDGDLVVIPEHGRLCVQTELGVLDVAPGELAILPRGLRFRVALPDRAARGFVAELFDGHLALPDRGPIGANGLADERHFQAPVAAFEDDRAPWTIVVRQGGHLWEVEAAASPFDVVAWHGTYAPWKYDLARFNSLGSVSFDHPDPSIMTVLTCPVAGHPGDGRSALDVAVFRGRWDVAEHTFRPPFFHRNSASEFNGVVASPAGSRWQPGVFTWSPYLTPHAISARGYQQTVTAPDEVADRPERLPDDSLWIQFESAYLLKVMPWMLDHPARDREHLAGFADFRPRAAVPG
jgi:homogentisate 1,2-dioxygenase